MAAGVDPDRPETPQTASDASVAEVGGQRDNPREFSIFGGTGQLAPVAAVVVRVQAAGTTDIGGRAGQGEVGRSGGVDFRAIDKDAARGGFDIPNGFAGWVDEPPSGREVVGRVGVVPIDDGVEDDPAVVVVFREQRFAADMAGLQGPGEVEPPRPIPVPVGIEGAGASIMVAHVDAEDIVDEGGPRTKRLGGGRKRGDWNWRWSGTATETARHQRK